MLRETKILLASLVLLGLQFLSHGLFANGTFSRATQPMPPVLESASHANAGAAKLDSPARTAGTFLLDSYGELAPRPAGFLSAKENAEISPRSSIAIGPFIGMTLAPKVSRYISKSVLNI